MDLDATKYIYDMEHEIFYRDSENYGYNEEGQLYWNTTLGCPLISFDIKVLET